MYENFSDRARRVMRLATQEALRFNHEYVGTEHILLGLVKEGTGIGATVIKSLGVDLRKIRLEVEKLVQSGPDMVTAQKLPLTPRARRVVDDFAVEEAKILEHTYIGTEHLLLGLIREGEGVAAQVLRALGIELHAVRHEVMTTLGRETEKPETKEQKEEKPSWLQIAIFAISNKVGLADMNKFLLEINPDDIAWIEHKPVGHILYAMIYYNFKI